MKSARPYVAIVVDSFRAALVSRVLWIAIFAIWLFLALLFPFGYREDYTTEFRNQDFSNGTRLKGLLARGLVDPDQKNKPVGRLAAAMPEDLRRQLRLVGKGDEVRIAYSVLTEALNSLIDDESWYDAEAWQSIAALRELRELNQIDCEDLSESLSRRRARLRIEAALPGVFQARSSRSVLLTYAGLDFPTGTLIPKPQFALLVNQFVLPFIINWLLGFVLIFLGILVTASIVPDMLQPGSLHLLLSKPISRTLLLLSKFFGGCAFVMLCVTQLVVGLYLVAGIRLDIWNPRLLWCIPVSVFLFAVFYSVSVLAALRWRSSILAIGVTVIFGGVCMLVGFVADLSDGFVTDPDKLTHLAVTGDQVVATTAGHSLVRFDAETDRWVEIFEGGPTSFDRVLAPVVTRDNQVITAQIRGGRINPFGSGAPQLSVLSQQTGWNPEPSLRLPSATSQLFLADTGSVFALNTSALLLTDEAEIRRAAGQTPKADEPPQGDRGSLDPGGKRKPEASRKPSGTAGWLSRLGSLIGGETEGFRDITPPEMRLTSPRSVAVDPAGKFVVAISGGRLVRAIASPGRAWTVTAKMDFEGDTSSAVKLAIAGDRLLLAQGDQPLRILDAVTLELIAEIDLSSVGFASQLLGVSGWAGQSMFLVVTSQGDCRKIPTSVTSAAQLASFAKLGPGEITCVHYDRRAQQLYFAHHVDRVDVVDPVSQETLRTLRPRLTGWRRVDQVVITPLRWLTPQTGALGDTIAAMIGGESTFRLDMFEDESETVRLKIAGPVTSCTVFILICLGVSCVYFATRDF